MTISVRAKFALLSLAVVLLFANSACAGNANRLRLALGRTASIGPVNQTVTLRGTDLEPIPLTAAVALCTSTELINVSFTGSVVPVVWNFPMMAASITYSFYKNELVANQGLTLAQTTALSDGANAGQMTVSCSGGTYITQFDVASPEIIAWNYGAKTILRYAGYPTSFLNGGATDWTTADPNWEVWNNHLTIKCVPTGGVCTAQGGTTYSTGSVAPAIAVASRTGADVPVVITSASLGATKTITMHWVAGQWDFAPTPSGITNNAGNNQLCISLLTAHNYGDVMMGESSYGAPLDYGSATINCTGNSALLPTVGSGGPSKPTLPYDAGWVKVTSRVLLGGKFNIWKLDTRGISTGSSAHKEPAVRFTGLDCATYGSESCFLVQDAGASSPHVASLVQWDHMWISGMVNGPSQEGNWNLYFTDNLVDGTIHGDGLLQLFSWDCKIDGNKFDSSTQDAIDFYCPATTPGSGFNSVSWNFVTNKREALNGGHSDFSQLFGGPANWTGAITQGVNDGPVENGNILARGLGHIVDCADIYTNGVVGSYDKTATTCKPPATLNPAQLIGLTASNIGNTELLDGQVAFRADINGFGEIQETTKIAGMIGIGNFGNGFAAKWAGQGSYMRRSIIIPSYYTTNTLYTGGAQPTVSLQGGSALVTLEDNILVAVPSATANQGIAPLGSGYVDNGHTNVTNFTSASLPNASLNTWGTIQNVLDYVNTFATFPGKGASLDVANIDYRRRTISAAMTATPTIGAPPQCTTAETVAWTTGTGTNVGDVATVTGASTMTGSPTSAEDQWFIFAVNGSTSSTTLRETGTTHTNTSADIAHAGTVNLYHTHTGANANGKGTCTANVLALP